MTTEDRQREITMMKTPDHWPRWPILPVKRSGHILEPFGCGIMVASADCALHIYDIDMFLLQSGPLGPQLDAVEHKEYQDYDAILDDGWVVD